MPFNLQNILDAPIIELDSIDSTNNYAMRLIDADTAQNGLTIVSGRQTQGKGQRGRVWQDEAGQSLLMSIILMPEYAPDLQFRFSAAVASAIADLLCEWHEHWNVSIKWPNDIIINDKKAGGILIENVWRGNKWSHSVVGLGLNVGQSSFPAELPQATSLKIASGKDFDIKQLTIAIRAHIIRYGMDLQHSGIERYNQYLFRRNQQQTFVDQSGEWKGTIMEVSEDGRLQIANEQNIITGYTYGTITWKWL